MVQRNIFLPVREVKPRLAKDIRLEGMQPYFVAHKVHVKKRHTELIQELLAFPKGRNDDTLDALHNALVYASRASAQGELEEQYFQAAQPSWRIV